MAQAQAFPPIEELIPHRAPMVLLDGLLDWQAGAAVCGLTLRPGAPFVDDAGQVEPAVAIEYMAQGVAACLGYEALRGGEGVRVGMIIGCRKFETSATTFPLGRQLKVVVKRKRGNESLSHFDCSLIDGPDVLAEAMLTLYHAERPPEDGSF